VGAGKANNAVFSFSPSSLGLWKCDLRAVWLRERLGTRSGLSVSSPHWSWQALKTHGCKSPFSDRGALLTCNNAGDATSV